MAKSSYTGRGRRKTTRFGVRAADVISRFVITIGGIGTIVAVSLVGLSLLVVVAPLFSSAEIGSATKGPIGAEASVEVLHVALDEYRTMGWRLAADGQFTVFRLKDGETVRQQTLFADDKITAISVDLDRPAVALGFEQGTVRFGTIRFKESYFERRDMPDQLRELPDGESAVWDDGVVQRTPQGQFRKQTVEVNFRDPVKLASSAIRRLDHIAPDTDQSVLSATDYRVVCCVDDGLLQAGSLTEKVNDFTGETTLDINLKPLPVAASTIPEADALPLELLLTSAGDNVCAIWGDGRLLRFDIRDLNSFVLAEQLDVTTDPGTRVTVCQLLLGRETLVCGDSSGGLSAWFRVRHDRAVSGDVWDLTRVHVLPPGDAAVTSLSASQRSRMLAAGYANGTLRVFHVTTDQLLLSAQVAEGKEVKQVGIAAKDDGLFAVAGGELWRADFDPAYPEATLASLFTPVWYEGHEKPKHIWQSSYATSAPEMKLGLWPLVFGTLKATFYTMLFGAPLALLAAIYTSEFMHSRMRAKVKPVVEIMASLPSVVLGFMAALIFAPIVEQIVPAVLASFVTVPVCFLLCAYLWQLMPRHILLLLAPHRIWFQFLPFAAGLWLAFASGRLVESWFFAGNIQRWLNDTSTGTGLGAWLMAMIPASGVVTSLFVFSVVNPQMKKAAERLSGKQFATLNLLKFIAALAVAWGLAYVVSMALTAIGLDPRGTFVDTYQQRNALVVGFVMGFAVIPIIYTIADDALSTVPNHLRSASLGCGATQWQTAVRVVIPTAMSGLFSALMIGLGRAVGETMIVLMAGGNTPVTEWNIFSGFRTLSANIAVELPEAVKNSTHYRTLFLAALTLFVMTFVVNTLAEVVRLRFRRRAYQL